MIYRNDSEIMKAIHKSSSKKFLYISTFGFYKDTNEFTSFPHKDKKLIVGIPRLNPCREGCPNCTLKYMNTLKYSFKRMCNMYRDGFDIRVSENVHMKIFIFGHSVIIGGINLTGSSFIDMSVKKPLQDEKEEYLKIFQEIPDIDMRKMYKDAKKTVDWRDYLLTFGSFKGKMLGDTNKDYFKWFDSYILNFDQSDTR